MKTLRTLIVVHLVLWGSLMLFIYEAKSELEVSASVEIHAPGDFYQPLTGHGTWVEVGTYGRCFRPEGIDVEWRPYCEGSWVWTDCGWYWQSDEPWAWACYHYGSWVDDPAQGWIWVPGIEWAPAWVTWRTGGDFVGWAPCAPRGITLAPAVFVFVGANHFQDPVRRASVTVNDATVINQTRLLAGPGHEKRTIDGKTQEIVINHGPDMEAIQKATGKQMKTVPIQDVIRGTATPHVQGSGDRKVEPDNQREPAASGDEKRPSNEMKDQVLPNQDPNLPSERPTETRQPAVESPGNLPKQDGDAPERAVPDKTPGAQPEKPAETGQPYTQHRQLTPSHKTPSPPPRQEKPANPPKEEKPANPPQGQEKKDGLGRRASMLAQMFCHPSSCSGLG